MSGLYLHIPFCNSKCAYCGFYSVPSLKRKGDFLDALRLEMLARKDYLEGDSIGTIYFGGGTPSILSVEEIGTILQWIKGVFTVNADAEITLEANPDTLSLDYLKGLRAIGVNRLSIGIQSFFDNDLKYLSRRHDSRHALECVPLAKEAGFANISLDLIYGLPTSDAEQWHRNLELFFEMDVPHLSAYALTLEPNSILTKQIEKGMALPISEDDALRDYEILCARTREEGFLHYEISNFCKPGYHSRHNSSYWFGIPYLGLGPSAHSYNGSSRQWNVSSVKSYLEVWRQETEDRSQKSEVRSQESEVRSQESEVRRQETGVRRQETEDRRQETEVRRQETEVRSQETRECGGAENLTPEQVYDEYVMLRLRTMWGIDLKYLKREMGERFADHCARKALPLIEEGRLSQIREFLYLTDEQMLFADGVAEALFW